MLVKLQLHDGKELSSTFEEFDLEIFVEAINKSNGKMITFGNYGIVGNAIRLVEVNQQVVAIEE